MKISILSFSYKRGLPEDESGNGGGFVFDCRAMPNPFWDEALRDYSGCDKPVVDFFEQHKDRVDCFLNAVEVLIRQSIEQYQKDGREHLDRMSAEDRDLLTEMRLELFRFLNGNGEVFKDR